MEKYSLFLTDWLNVSGDNCIVNIASGAKLYRIATVEPTCYATGFVSIGGGTCKPPGESGNWYAMDLTTAVAETKPSGNCVYEVWSTTADVPAFNARCLPPSLWGQIHDDRTLPAPRKFEKSWALWSGATNLTPATFTFLFASRQGSGTVTVLNPHTTPMQLMYSGCLPLA